MSVYKDFTNKNFNKALADLIETKKMSITTLAKKTGITTQYIYQILNEQRLAPNDENITKIANAFDLSPGYFKEYRNRRLNEIMLETTKPDKNYDVPLSEEEITRLQKIIDEAKMKFKK